MMAKGAIGTQSDFVLISMPVGLFWPTWCSAQMCSATTPAITNGSRKCSEKKRLSVTPETP